MPEIRSVVLPEQSGPFQMGITKVDSLGVYIYTGHSKIKLNKVPGGNMATLRKTEFFRLEIAGKIRTYSGFCLDHLSALKERSLMKSHWI
jgi:hypothetical protein